MSQRQFVVISAYTRFDNLAHGPRGTEAKHSMYTFELLPDGQMVMLSVDQKEDAVMNPAFSRYHPEQDILYACTESVKENGELVSWRLDPTNGKLTKLGACNAGGTSTCYITLDKPNRHMLIVNYWDSTVRVFRMCPGSHTVKEQVFCYDPNEGKGMKVSADKHVNHSINDESAQKERQADPHSHAIVLDPVKGRFAYVPDLGKDLIRQFVYDEDTGVLVPQGSFKSGPDGRTALGPRYIDFHPQLPVAYVVNELSSEVSVFVFDPSAFEDLEEAAGNPLSPKNESPRPTLKLVQTVSTIPPAFPPNLNTCGRVCTSPDGSFVLCANRGHDSIATFKVQEDGRLATAKIVHTRGATPRHFAFDNSGKFLLAANQDSDNVAVFKFSKQGDLVYTGNSYHMPSPNFVCCMTPGATGRDRLHRIYHDPPPKPAKKAAKAKAKPKAAAVKKTTKKPNLKK